MLPRLESINLIFTPRKQMHWNTIWGQSSPTMHAKVKSVKSYEAQADAHICLLLLQPIKAIPINYESKKNPYVLSGSKRKVLFMQAVHQ